MDGLSTIGKLTHNRLNTVKLSRDFGKITESLDLVLDICSCIIKHTVKQRVGITGSSTLS
jgi:hypothetical protein